MSPGHQRITWRRNIAENVNQLSRVHERYRQTDRQTTDRQTDGRRHIANMNMSSRSLKIKHHCDFCKFRGQWCVDIFVILCNSEKVLSL